MRSIIWVLSASLLVGLGGGSTSVFGQETAKSDKELLQGTWECIQTIKSGENVKTWVGVKAVIEGDSLTWHYPNADGTYRQEKVEYRIDPARKHFDWWRPAKPGSVDVRLYSVTANEMRMTTNLDFKTRPEALDKGTWQFTCKRVTK